MFLVEPQQSVERLRAQSGAFLISAFHERLERSQIVGGTIPYRLMITKRWSYPLRAREES